MNDFFVSLMLLGGLSSGGYSEMPFWSTAGQFGVMPEVSGGLALLRAGSAFDESKTLQWRWGASLGLRNDYWGVDPFVDELNAGLRWKQLRLDAGMIHPEQHFLAADPSLGSLSVTSGNIMMSCNARTMPGIAVTLEPWSIPFTADHVQLAGRFGDYWTIDRRHMQGARVHDTAIYLLGHIGRFSITFGIDNYTMWAGTAPDGRVQPHSFRDYLRAITGRPGGSDASEGDQINSLGDHRGRELIRLDYKDDNWTLTLQHDIPYDDRSGMKTHNFPDGANTICFSLKDKSAWVSDIVYEFQYTMNQSGDCERRLATAEEIADNDPRLYYNNNDKQYYTIVGGADNYCNNYDYVSGWTAFTRQIGNPLFYSRWTRDDKTYYSQGTWNNLLKAHHLGISGSLFRKIPYRLVLTYSLNYGCWFDAKCIYNADYPYKTPLRQFSSGFSASIPILKGAMCIIPAIYFDKGEALSDAFAATIAVKYTFKKR